MDEPQEIRIPLVEENISIGAAKVVDGRVRVSTKTELVTETAEAELGAEQIEVTRVPIGREVTSVPEPRTDGDVTIIPVFEERLVIEKRLFLVEEVHIRRVKTSETIAVPVEVRKQKVIVERTDNSTKTKD